MEKWLAVGAMVCMIAALIVVGIQDWKNGIRRFNDRW